MFHMKLQRNVAAKTTIIIACRYYTIVSPNPIYFPPSFQNWINLEMRSISRVNIETPKIQCWIKTHSLGELYWWASSQSWLIVAWDPTQMPLRRQQRGRAKMAPPPLQRLTNDVLKRLHPGYRWVRRGMSAKCLLRPIWLHVLESAAAVMLGWTTSLLFTRLNRD